MEYLLKEEEIPNDYIRYMENHFGDMLNGSKRGEMKARAWARKVEKIDKDGRHYVENQVLPKVLDLPDWLQEAVYGVEEEKDENVVQNLNNYTLVFNAIVCAGKYLSHIEVRLWSMLRMRVKDKDLYGYYEKECLPTSNKLLSQWMGCSEQWVIKTKESLREKGLIKVTKRKGTFDKIQLTDLNDWLKTRKKEPALTKGYIKSLIAPEQTIKKAAKYARSKIKKSENY